MGPHNAVHPEPARFAAMRQLAAVGAAEADDDDEEDQLGALGLGHAHGDHDNDSSDDSADGGQTEFGESRLPSVTNSRVPSFTSTVAGGATTGGAGSANVSVSTSRAASFAAPAMRKTVRVRIFGGDDEPPKGSPQSLSGMVKASPTGAHGGPGLTRTIGTLASMRLGASWVQRPDGLPELHGAVWSGDIDHVRGILVALRGKPLGSLIWVNPELHGGRLSMGGNRGGDSDSDAMPHVPQRDLAPTEATPKSAVQAMRSLLHAQYLRHACHPLTIAAARGDSLCVEALLQHIKKRGEAHEIAWEMPPPVLPPGCPWVTPLAAAALSGDADCVELIASSIKPCLRGKGAKKGAAKGATAVRDRSSWGAFSRCAGRGTAAAGLRWLRVCQDGTRSRWAGLACCKAAGSAGPL